MELGLFGPKQKKDTTLVAAVATGWPGYRNIIPEIWS